MATNLDTLREKHGLLDEAVALLLFRQLTQTVWTMWDDFNVTHNDLKPDNLIISLTNYRIFLIDFGCATRYTGGPLEDFIGCEIFIPPEFRDRDQRFPQNAAVYSMGLVLYNMCHWDLPFETEMDKLNGQIHFRSSLSLEYVDLVKACIDPDPNRRIRLREILEHPWLQQTPIGAINGNTHWHLTHFPPVSQPEEVYVLEDDDCMSQDEDEDDDPLDQWLPIKRQNRRRGDRRRHREENRF